MYDFSFIPDDGPAVYEPIEEKLPRRLVTHELRLQAFHRALQENLTERQRSMLTMYYLEHKNTVEIASILSVNKSTVSRTIRRSVEKLRAAMRIYLGEADESFKKKSLTNKQTML